MATGEHAGGKNGTKPVGPEEGGEKGERILP